MDDIRSEMSDDEILEARKIFRGDESGKSGCWHCGALHDRVANLPQQRQPCPRVKRAVWHADGSLLEVEYWRPGTWEDADAIYPSDVFGVVLDGDGEA